MEVIRRHYTFYGQVQGVGFRFRARHAAQSLRVSGWVKNEWDGSVEMELQGRPEELAKVIEMIRGGMFIDIRDMRVKEIPVEAELGFHVR